MPRIPKIFLENLKNRNFYGILYIEKDGVGPKGQTPSNRGAQSRASVLTERQAAEDARFFQGIKSQASTLWDFFYNFTFMPRTERKKRLEMERMPRTQAQNYVHICQIDELRQRIIFTRIIFVSWHPRIIRMVRIEKEVSLK